MQSGELTIQLTPEEIGFLQEYATEHGLTVSEVIDRYIKRLQKARNGNIHPDVESITGIIPRDIDGVKEYHDHLLKKH